MKRILITVLLCFTGMTIFAQDMSYYTREYMRQDGTFRDRLIVLENIRDAGITGIGDFYQEALKFLLLRAPDIRTRSEQEAAERSVIILSQGIGAEKHTAAGLELWQAAEFFDVVRGSNEGNAMQSCLIALGQIDAREFIPHIAQRLHDYNTQTFRNAETRRRYQTAVIGCINALETFKDISGFNPVFFASVGSYDPAVKQIASDALPNITEDPGEVISAIINETANNPMVKLEAWNQMLKSKAPDASKAKTAAVALATGWSYVTSDRAMQERLRDMRKSAIDTMRQFGIPDNSVYTNLERSYSSNFNNRAPDYDEIMLTLNTLAAVKSDEAVDLLLKFLRELHGRRVSGPWGDRERQVFQWVVSCLGVTGTSSQAVKMMLTTIQRTADYTPFEQGLARNALNSLGG